jgi:hypothetical protein
MPRNDGIAVLLNSAKAQIDKGHIYLPPGDNATETLERVPTILSQASRADLLQVIDLTIVLYERAQKAAAVDHNLDEAEHAMALANKLSMKPAENQASDSVPDRGTAIAHGLLPETAGVAPPPERNGGVPHPGPSSDTPPITATDTGAAASVTTAAQRSPSLSIHFVANSSLAEAQARQLLARFGPRFDHTEMHSETDMPSTAIIRYFSASDHSAARDVGRHVGEMGYAWHIESLSTSRSTSPQDLVEVWIPKPRSQN